MIAIWKSVPSKRVLDETLRRMHGQPAWAVHLPGDPSSFHTGTSEKARLFQETFAEIRPFGGWVTSHMCIMHIVKHFWANLPRRYLEIGVNEGFSVLAMLTAVKLQKLALKQSLLDPLFDEFVLADMWQRVFGGVGRGSHQHIDDLLRSQHVGSDQVIFLDGDSKETIPGYLKSRKSRVPFDVIYVDGDHSYAGAKADLENVLPHVGKVLFFDDIYHPAHCLEDRLLELHREMVERLKKDFYVFLNRHCFGFAAFIRKEVFEALP
jgi:hypothetical protein